MKKKLLNILACLSIILIGAFALVGCGDDPADPHTHNYNKVEYTIEQGKAYKVTTCGCNDFKKEEVVGAIIATPETIENILNETNNATIVLSAGVYENEVMWFKSYNTPTENLNIVGVKGAEVEEIYASVHDGGKITNLYISNIKFTGLGVHSNHTEIDGLTVENCEFIGLAGVGFGNVKVKNIVVKNCTFDFSNEAVETQTAVYFNEAVENFTVENCTFKNIPYNAIQANVVVTGKIIIKNNKFVETGSRVIYLNGITNVENVELEIELNNFCTPTTPKSDGNFVKAGTEIEISKNNTWNIESGKAENYYFSGAYIAD